MVTLCKVNHFHYFLQGFLYAVSSKSEFIYSYFPLFLSSTLLFSLTTRAFPITQHRNAPHNIEMLLIFFFPFSILFFPFLPPCLPSFRPDAWHPLCGWLTYLAILLLIGNWVISNCLLSPSVRQCFIIYMCEIVSLGKYWEVGLPGQMAHASVILIDMVKFSSIRVVMLCNPKTRYESCSRLPKTLLLNVAQIIGLDP